MGEHILSKFLILGLLSVVLVGCASKPEDIQAIDYPDSAYSNLNCDQLAMERSRISDDVLEATGRQRAERKKDQAWGWTGALLFAPALFMMDGNDENAIRLAQLKGQYEAVGRVSTAKNCAAASRTAAAPAEKPAPGEPAD